MKKIISLLVVLCLISCLGACSKSGADSSGSVPSKEFLRSGTYYQQLGKESYDPKIGICFKDEDEYAQKNYENATYFDNWMKTNHTGFYRVMESELDEYDFKLELEDRMEFKKTVFYVKTIDGKDKIELFEHTPNSEFTMNPYGTYLSEKFIKDNGYTEFDWSGMN